MFFTRPIWLCFDQLRQWHDRRTLEPTQALGRRGEDVAHRYLQRRGYAVVERNWRSRVGLNELDLVAWLDGDPMRLVVVEVKSRRSGAFAAPDRNIDGDKREAVRWATREYCRRKRVAEEAVRFDTVSVVFEPELRVEHHEDAFGWHKV